jgi:hypothetical protein
MSTNNLIVAEKPAMDGQKLPYVRKLIAVVIARMRQGEIGNRPITARGRALYTVDSFMNGKPVLPNHDGLRVPLRRAFAA